MLKLLVQLAWVSGARIAALAMWIVGLIAIYRWFGSAPDGLAEAGAFALSLALVKAVTSCVGDAADLATMRDVPLLLRTDYPRAMRMLRAAMALRLGAGLGAALLLALLAAPIAAALSDDPARATLVRLAGVAIVAELTFRAAFAALQAAQRFVPLVALEGFLQASRLAIIAAILLSGGATAEAALAGYTTASLLAAAAGLALVPRSAAAFWRARRAELIVATRYVAWVFPAMALAAVTERADLFLLGALNGPDAAGLYGAMLPLALAPDLVGAFLAGVVQPKIAGLKADGSFRTTTVRMTGLFVPLAAAAAVVAVVFRHEVIDLTVGPAYAPVADAFAILVCGTLAWLALTPFALSAVVLARPRAALAVSLAQAVYVVVVGWPLVATYGPEGAAATVASMRVMFALALWTIAFLDADPARTRLATA